VKTQTTIRVDEVNYNLAHETQKALDELDARDGKSFNNVDELFADLDT